MLDLQDPACLEQMYEEYFRRIYNFIFCRLLHKEQTEDVVSRIFMKVLENRQSYDARKGSFNTWIFTIARNALNDFYRLKKPAVSLDDDCFTEPSVDFEAQSRLIADEELRELYLALTGLDDRARTVITLKYFGEFSNREIAAQTGINESTVSTLCCRGIAKLQKAMDLPVQQKATRSKGDHYMEGTLTVDDLKKGALSEEQLNDISGGVDIGSINLPIDIAGLCDLNTGPSPAEAMARAATHLGAAMGLGMETASQTQNGMQNIAVDTLWKVPDLKP